MLWLLLVISIILVIGVIVLLAISLSKTPSSPNRSVQSYSPGAGTGVDMIKEYQVPTDFRVFNYLPNHAVNVSVLDVDTGQTIDLVKGVRPNKTGGIVKEDIERYFKPGNVLKIYIVCPDGTVQHYTNNVLDTSCYETIKNLHVGMITTRFIGKSTDGLRMSTLADNAIQGHAWLLIHNLTEIPLRLNDDIVVAPHCTERYLGYLNQGVTLGTIFKDQDGIYPDFQYLNPHSDLYYGVVSDLRQPLRGPFQLEFSDDCDTDQTLWPFELGQM